jgi:deoxyhypusine synthase
MTHLRGYDEAESLEVISGGLKQVMQNLVRKGAIDVLIEVTQEPCGSFCAALPQCIVVQKKIVAKVSLVDRSMINDGERSDAS